MKLMAVGLRLAGPACSYFKITVFVLVYLSFAGCSGSSDGGGAAGAPRVPTAIIAQRYEDTVEVGARYDFSRVGVGGVYSDGSVRPVAARWFEGGKPVDPDSFFVPAEECVVRLTASYSEGISNFTLEVRLSVVKAFSGAYFSLDPRQNGTAEVFIGRDSPVMSFFIGSPTSEALIIEKLSFSLVNFSAGGAPQSASLSDGRRSWRAKPSTDGTVIEFCFDEWQPKVAANSVIKITLALDCDSFPAAPDGSTDAPRVSLGTAAGAVKLRGEFFGPKAMNNLNGLPLYSGPLQFQMPPASSYTVAAIPAGAGYGSAAATIEVGAPAVLELGSFDAGAEKLALLIINGSEASGAYALKAAALKRSAPAVFGPTDIAFSPGFAVDGKVRPAFKAQAKPAPRPGDCWFEAGQQAADGYMRACDEALLKSVPPPRYAASAPVPVRAAAAYKLGDQLGFYAVNVKTYQWHCITAEVAAVGERCYIFQETGMPAKYEALTPSLAAEAASRFDNEVYPKVTAAFGGEPNPGIDGDPKIFILFTRVVNEGTALGYFSAMNQYRRFNENGVEQFRYSNEKEIIFSAVRDRESEFKDPAGFFNLLFFVLAHEFQHMINWYRHSMIGSYEETWVNEGLSMLAEDEAGYGCQHEFYARRVAEFFAAAPSYSLDNFKYLDRGSYGYSYLFFKYLRERGAVPKNMVSSTKSGAANVEAEIIRAGIAPDFKTAFEAFVTALYFASEGVAREARHSFGDIRLRGNFNFAGAVSVTLAGIADSASVCPPAFFVSDTLNGRGFNLIRYATPSSNDAVGFYLKNTGSTAFRAAPARHFKTP